MKKLRIKRQLRLQGLLDYAEYNGEVEIVCQYIEKQKTEP